MPRRDAAARISRRVLQAMIVKRSSPPAVGLFALACVLVTGCSCRGGGGAADGGPGEAQAVAEAPPPIRVDATRADLLFTFATEGGRAFRSTARLDEVPETARKRVVVTDLSLSPELRQAGRYVYLADLTSPRGDGTYPVAVASRYGFEATETGSSTVAGSADRREVVVYSTSWCGACKKAKRLLASLRVPYVEKDVEASRAAQQELSEKARRQGFSPGGVPVIDVAGIMLQGLDEAALREALEARGFL